MGYYIQAIICTRSVLETHSGDYASAVIIPLASGLALIPITEELLDEIGASGESGKFYKFTPAVAGWLSTISASAPAAYVEAEYFGGIGGQSSTVWANGKELLTPTHEPQAINVALRLLGVSRGASHDEFECVGLGRHRETEDWLDDALPNNRHA